MVVLGETISIERYGRTSSYGRRTRLKSRVLAIVVALIVEVLVLIGLLTLGSSVGRKLKQSDAVIVHPWSGGHSTPKKSVSHHAAAVSYTHLTLPTNREV